MNSVRVVIAMTVFLAVAPAWAERIWDAELGRYLTPQEMGQEEEFLTEEEAARLMFPK